MIAWIESLFRRISTKFEWLWFHFSARIYIYICLYKYAAVVVAFLSTIIPSQSHARCACRLQSTEHNQHWNADWTENELMAKRRVSNGRRSDIDCCKLSIFFYEWKWQNRKYGFFQRKMFKEMHNCATDEVRMSKIWRRKWQRNAFCVWTDTIFCMFSRACTIVQPAPFCFISPICFRIANESEHLCVTYTYNTK